MASDLGVREIPDGSLPQLYEQASQRSVNNSGQYGGEGQKWKNEPSVHGYGHHVAELPGAVPNYEVANLNAARTEIFRAWPSATEPGGVKRSAFYLALYADHVQRKYLPEECLWIMFHSMAVFAQIMEAEEYNDLERGNPPYFPSVFIHSDIKPLNINCLSSDLFVQESSQRAGHCCVHICIKRLGKLIVRADNPRESVGKIAQFNRRHLRLQVRDMDRVAPGW
jgi:hypothetical protein